MLGACESGMRVCCTGEHHEEHSLVPTRARGFPAQAIRGFVVPPRPRRCAWVAITCSGSRNSKSFVPARARGLLTWPPTFTLAGADPRRCAWALPITHSRYSPSSVLRSRAYEKTFQSLPPSMRRGPAPESARPLMAFSLSRATRGATPLRRISSSRRADRGFRRGA